MRNTERALQKAREKKARRDKAGRAWRAKGIEDKMFMDREKERAENSAARESQLAGRLLGERTEALEMARAQVEILTPLSIDLPRTPSARRARTHRVQRRGDGLRGAPSVRTAVIRRSRTRADRHPRRQRSGKTTLFRLLTGELKPASGEVGRLTDRIAVLDQHIGLLDPG